MLNSVMIQGRITKELKPTRTQNNTPMLRFTLACDSDRKDQQGNRDADFINCMAFGKTVGMMNQYLHKGSKIIVHGRWVTSQGQDQNGNTTYYNACAVQRFWFDEPAPKNRQGNNHPQQGGSQGQPNYRHNDRYHGGPQQGNQGYNGQQGYNNAPNGGYGNQPPQDNNYQGYNGY